MVAPPAALRDTPTVPECERSDDVCIEQPHQSPDITRIDAGDIDGSDVDHASAHADVHPTAATGHYAVDGVLRAGRGIQRHEHRLHRRRARRLGSDRGVRVGHLWHGVQRADDQREGVLGHSDDHRVEHHG
jgi:hypothetical protein